MYARMNDILLATGLLTASAGFGVFAPRAFSNSLLGTSSGDAATSVIVRHWSLLLAIVGGLLIFAAYRADVRVPIMIAATIEKLILAALVVASPLRKRLVTVAIVGADVVMALLYVFMLAAPPSS
jgi:energy-converting hydrogenase Eha subunit E